MKAPKFQLQKTIIVDGEVIKMVARRRTQQANFAGWNIFINGVKIFKNCIEVEEAFEKAYATYIQKYR